MFLILVVTLSIMKNHLQDFIMSLPREQRQLMRDRIAKECGLSASMVRHMANGTRSITAENVNGIVRATGLKHSQLRPDIWPA